MKFPKFHYELILKKIKLNGFTLEEFFLVKRKGWIRIEHPASGEFFTYFKKKETRINQDSKQWEHDVFFKIKMNNSAEIVEPTFDSMLQQFDNWLKALN